MTTRSWRSAVLTLALMFGVLAPVLTPAHADAAPATTPGPDDRSVDRLYLAYFERVPDSAGQAFWSSRLDDGMSLPAISEQFARSPEFVTLYGGVSDDAFVELVYQNVLDRSPDAGGLSHWTNQLATGVLTRGEVMLGFSDSAEFKTTTGIIGLPPFGPDGRSVERLYLA